MFGLLNSSQIYGLQQTETTTINNNSSTATTITTTSSTTNSKNNNNSNKNNRQLSKLARNVVGCGGGGGGGSGGGGGGGLAGGLAQHLQGMKVPANFIEKLIKSELLTGYEAVKHFKNFHHSTRHHHQPLHLNSGSNLKSIDCDNLHGNYRSGNFADEDINSCHHEMTIIKYPNDIQHQHHQTSATDMEEIDSSTINTITTTTGSSILRNCGGSILQREDSLNGNSNEMISDHSSSTKSNDPSSSSSADSPETERKTSPSATSNPDRVQRRKLLQMITFLDQQNQRLQKELAKEKRRRNEELSRIIKSLICMESKLKIDKKQINQRLLEKDTEICRLVSLNRALRKKFNAGKENCTASTTTTMATAAEADCLVLEALQCNSCKQKFYAIETKESWTQTTKDGRKSNDDPTTEHGSSSDDTVSSSFYGARRSVRYTSKRTFGTFRDYMRSRSMNIDDPNLDNSEENASTISRDDSQNSYEKMNIYSRAIDRLHGVRRVSSIEGDLDSEYDNSSSRKNQSHSSGIEEDDMFSPAEDDRVFSPKDEKMELSPCNSKNNSLSRSKDFSEASPKQEFETSTDDWYASASDGEEESESVRTKSYGYNVAVNPVLECVNQILLQQSMEESMNDSQPTSLEGNDNPNLCSSQRGGRQSRSSSNGSTKDQGNTGTISRKRVHFSTKNSMVHVPRDDDHDHDMHHMPSPLSSPSASVIADQIKDNILNYESIYSNEYEPIGSENNSSNLYVDMETKLSPEERTNIENKPPKQPPALPPKPANLIKFKKALKVSVPQLHFDESEEQAATDDKSVISEPDYCSISEVNMTMTNVQVIVDVHKEPQVDSSTEMESLKSDTQSMKTDEIEEIFADIPKLPNVAAIIAPKTPPSSKLNYLPQSRDAEVASKLQRSPRQFKRKHVPNILAEINKRINNSNPTTPTKNINQIPNGILTMSTPPKKAPTPIIKLQTTSSPIVEDKQLPLQAEFDWYNLDVEYGKSSSNQPDIIRASDVNSIEENEDGLMGLHGVEYNLDEEFSLAGGNQPDIIKENRNESPKTINGISSPKTVCEDFPIITEVTPCLKKIKKTANFDKFIDSSGLSTKPLPRQRKIYFAGPFV